MSRIIKESNIIKKALLKQVLEGSYPFLYSVITFGFYDNQGFRLPPSEVSRYWNKSEVETTCKLVHNLLKEHLEIETIYFFIERHAPLLDENGEKLRDGRFHINIISSAIEDAVVEEPNRKLRRLMLEDGSLGVPIKDMVFHSIDDMKIELFNQVCRKANWISKYRYAIKTQYLEESMDVENALYYCLKDYKDGGSTDFMDLVVFKASDFYKP